jgi:hypothetical protein
LVVNVALGFAFSHDDWKHKQKPPNPNGDQVRNQPPDARLGISPGLYEGYYTDQQVGQLAADFFAFNRRGFPYAPWVGYEMTTYQSPMLNVDLDNGTGLPRRRTLETTHTHDSHAVEIWCFGGSTMFGVDVGDRDTLPANLERILNQRAHARWPDVHFHVTNFGRPGYYSSQEAALLQAALRAHDPPAGVVFLDGVNDVFYLATDLDVPMYTDRVHDAVQQAQVHPSGLHQYTWVPLVRLAFEVRHQILPPVVSANDKTVLVPDRVYRVYGRNVDMIRGVTAGLGMQCYMFWQPVSFYRHNLDTTPSVPQMVYDNAATYRAIYGRIEQDNPRVCSLSGLGESYGPHQIYLDFCHYTPGFTTWLAGQMADRMDLQALVNSPLNRR